jgi:hypothetical protein
MHAVPVSNPGRDLERARRRFRTGWSSLLTTALVLAAKADLLALLPW